MAELHCIVVTPEQTVRETDAEFVAVVLFDGEIGIQPGHSPLIGRLGYGEMRIKRGSVTERYYVEGGFVEVAKNVVSILTNRAVPSDKLDVEVARKQFDSASALPTNTPELRVAHDDAVAKARGQLRTAQK